MEFQIRRLNTAFGIFRVSGLLENEQTPSFNSVEFMSTDGWCAIDLNSKSAQFIVSQLQSLVVEHLKIR